MSGRLGKWIVVEGIDGSGKTTQAKMLATKIDAFYTYEPGDSLVGEDVRNVLLKSEKTLHPLTEVFLLQADRVEHLQKIIIPKLEEGKNVVCDRYVGSTFAYQGYGRGVEFDKLESIVNIAISKVMPDLTILYDLPSEEVESRLAGRSTDRIENEGKEFRKRVEQGYKALSKRFGWKVIDASGSIDEVANRTLGEIKSAFGEAWIGNIDG